MYHRLNADKIVDTLGDLVVRMQSEVGGTSLSDVGRELAEIAEVTRERARRIARPNIPIRIGIWTLLAVIVLFLSYKVLHLRRSGLDSLTEVIPVFEAGLNIAVVMGAGVFFLGTLETRLRRHRVLLALSELRSIVHVIDMHQLQKDPDQLISHTEADGSEDARHQYLSGYLDFCAELIALTGKLAGLYMEQFEDPVIIATVAEIDSLITGISQKLWLKISIIHTTMLLAQPRVSTE